MINDGVDDRRNEHVGERGRSEFGFIALPLTLLVDPGQPVLKPSRTVRADDGAHHDRRKASGRPRGCESGSNGKSAGLRGRPDGRSGHER